MNEKHEHPSVQADIKRDLSISMGKAYVLMFVIVGPLWVALIILYSSHWGIGNLLEGLAKLTDWMGREANYRIVVEEPLSSSPRRKRLIAVYSSHTPTS